MLQLQLRVQGLHLRSDARRRVARLHLRLLLLLLLWLLWLLCRLPIVGLALRLLLAVKCMTVMSAVGLRLRGRVAGGCVRSGGFRPGLGRVSAERPAGREAGLARSRSLR